MTEVANNAPEAFVVNSSGNIFADLNLPASPEDMLKVEIARVIGSMLRVRRLTQRQAAEIIGTDQAKISCLLRGRLNGFSTERLLGYLLALGFDVDIRLSENADGKPGHMSVSQAA